MTKEPVVIPARPDQREAPPSRHVIVSIGGQRYKIETNTKIMLLPSCRAEVIPIDLKRRRSIS